jgi:hypothetical protein
MNANVMKKLLWTLFYCLPLIAFAANLPERGHRKALPAPAPASFPSRSKVIIYKSRRTQSPDEFRPLNVSVRLRGTAAAAQSVKAFVQARALKYGVNPTLAIWIVRHESQFNPRAKGDGEASRGLWQISRIYHPEVSDAVAFNMVSSTDWSLGRIRAGKANEWSTYHYCREQYRDCPF